MSHRAIKLSGHLSLVALVVGVGACSNFGRSPVFTGSTNQQEIILGQGQSQGYGTSPLGNTYVGAQSGAVQGADLPPPSGAPSSATAYAPQEIQQPQQQQQAYASGPRPQPYTPPQGAQSAASHGQRGAPPTTLNQQAAAIDQRSGSRSGSTVHVVQAGDTAWNISQRYGITVDQLAAATGGSTTVRLGSRIAIPGGGSASRNVQVASLDPRAGVPQPSPASAPQVPQAAAQQPQAPLAQAQQQRQQQQNQQVAVAPQTGNAGALAPAAPEPSASSASGFRWPVRGRVISGFGKKPNGERNDGINLAVPEGTAVKAAEDGTVIYAGNELKSYGNLVLVRHSSGWVSAYAHNSELKVKRGDQVRRGQVIALSGMSGGVTTPQVHFELRKDAAPVDPLQHLSET